MKNLILLFCGLFITYSVMAIDHNKLISLNFKHTPLNIILQTLADYQQVNLIVDESVNQNLSITLHQVTWKKALDTVLAQSHLEMLLQDNIMLITAKNKNSADAKNNNSDTLSLSMAVIKLTYYDTSALATLIQQHAMLSLLGKVIADTQNNQIIIKDTPQHIQAIKKLVTQLDHPQKQISISAHIVTMTRESIEELGVKWGFKGEGAQTINHLGFNLPVTNPTASVGIQLAKFNGNFLNLELSALEAENNVEIIANPRLITGNRKTASIKQGTEIPYEVSSGSNGATSIEFKQAVLGLEVTPVILNNGQLELTLYITQNTIGQSIKRSDGGESLTIDTQEIKTQLIVKNGETLVLGGILQQLNNKTNRAVPGLSKIPIIGNLFKHKANKLQQRELIIFITPTIEV